MKRFREPFLVLAGLALLLVASSSVFAQENLNFGGWPTQLQSRNIPAGNVVDPGSSLLYIIDTGINARAILNPELEDEEGDSISTALAQTAPFRDGDEEALFDANGNVLPGGIFQNFIAITNTHPTQAVTVHFRYFNDECVDVLDFLVLLTCNDTLIFDPFNFTIPGTTFNTRTRIFGPAQGLLTPIPVSTFGSGRFLIFATAAGASFEPQNTGTHDDNAEFRFPNEFDDFINEDHECDNLTDDTFFGVSPGITENNLSVFNANAVAFNYLIGHSTGAVPRGFITDLPEGASEDQFLAYGVNAWTRPAVDLTADNVDGNTSTLGDSAGDGDGDGPPLTGINDYRILTGGEPVTASDQETPVATNLLYLRNEVHGGSTEASPTGDDVFNSFYGALGWSSLMGAEPENQLVHFLSIVDDYNGSKQVGGFGAIEDTSYNVAPATTVYVLQLYDNDENLFLIFEDQPPNFSPPLVEQPIAELKITVDCLRVFITSTPAPQTSVDDFQISDLALILPEVVDFLTKPPADPAGDVSQGWIRFVRDNSEGGTFTPEDATTDTAFWPTFVTIGQVVVKFESFGASYWLSSAASNAAISESGNPAN